MDKAYSECRKPKFHPILILGDGQTSNPTITEDYILNQIDSIGPIIHILGLTHTLSPPHSLEHHLVYEVPEGCVAISSHTYGGDKVRSSELLELVDRLSGEVISISCYNPTKMALVKAKEIAKNMADKYGISEFLEEHLTDL